jgi:hypothetical protein
MLPDFYFQVIGVTIMAIAGYIALVFMASKALGRPQLTAYAKIEANQLFISGVILVAALGAWHFSNMMMENLTGYGLEVAPLRLLDRVINEGILPVYVKLVRMEVLLTYFNAIEYRMGPGVWNFITRAVPGLDPLISIVRMLIFSYTALYGTFSVFVIIFTIVPGILYPFILPAGIVLRFFPPTRDAGVYLIALALAFQTLFPILYVLNFVALSEMWVEHGWVDDDPDRYDEYTPNIENTNYFADVADASEEGGSLANFASGQGTTLISDFSSWFPVLQPFSFPALMPFLDRVAQLSLVGLVLPALVFTLVLAMVSAVTKFITGKG